MTIPAINDEISQFNEMLVSLKQFASEVKVVDFTSATQALSMGLQARKIISTMEESRKKLTKPHFDYQKAINQIVKDIQSKFQEIEDSLKLKLDCWVISEKENPFTKLESIDVEDGKYYLKKNWEYRIEDSSRLPTEYLCADTVAIEKAVKNGVRDIAGVKIYETEESLLRVKN